MSVGELRSALDQFYSPTTAADAKAHLERQLSEFRKQPQSHHVALQILQHQHQHQQPPAPSDLYLLYFAGAILEELMLRRWDSTQRDERRQLRQFLFAFVVDSWRTLPRWVLTKVGKALVDAAKHTWPAEDPSFLDDVMALARSDATRPCGLFLLTLFAEELVRGDLLVLTARRAELHAALRRVLPAVLELLSADVDASIAALQRGGDQQAACDALTAALTCLEVLLGWSELAEAASPRLLGALLSAVEAAAADPAALSECGVRAMTCVMEVLGKRLVPAALQPLVLQLAHHMLATLRLLTRDGGAALQSTSDAFLSSLVQLLNVLLDRHMPRIIAQADSGSSAQHLFPVGDLLDLLATFTFQQPDMEGLRRCLEPWSAFATMSTEGEERGGARAALAQQHREGLAHVCEQLLGKALYMTNAEGLAELEDSPGSRSGDGDSARGGGDALEQDEDDADGDDGCGAGPPSEVDAFVAEVLELLSVAARVPRVAARLGDRALALFSAAGVALEVCRGVLAARAYERGAAHVRLQVALFGALSRLAPALAAPDDATAAQLVDGACAAAAAALDPSAAAPEAVALASALTIRALARSQPPARLAASAPLQALLAAATTAAQGGGGAAAPLSWLPPRARVAVHAALAEVLLPPGSLSGVALKQLQPRIEDRGVALAALAAPAVAALVTAGQRAPALNSEADFGAIHASCRVLAALCRTFRDAPTVARSALHASIAPALRPAAALVAPCVRGSSGGSSSGAAAGAAAAALLRLLVAAVTALPRDASAELATDALDALLALSGESAVGADGGARGRLLAAGVFWLLAAALGARTPRVAALAPRAAALALQVLDAGGDAVALDFLRFAEALLDNQWHCFVEGVAKSGDARALVAAGGAAALFRRVCDALCRCACGEGADAAAAARAAALLRRHNAARALFALGAFAAEQLPWALGGALRRLARGDQPLVAEELALLARELAAVNQVVFVRQFLPHFLETFPQLPDGARNALLALWPPPPMETSAFDSAQAAFLNDLRYYVMLAS